MNIGGLTIEMAADLARLRQDMDAAKQSVGNAMEGISKAVDLAKAAFVGYLGVASFNAFKGMVMGAIDATGALHDLSQQTGNSAAALAQFRSIGAYSETSMESIAGASLKLSKNLALADEEGKGAALAIKALGLDFDTFSKMNPDQRMLAAAKALGEYEDGADKSAAAMLLFGKEGAKMLPFLADLADQADEVTAKLSDQDVATKKLQASMADAFGDNLTKISKNSDAWKKDLSLGLLPAMYEASEAFLQMNNGAGGLKAQISQLAKDGTLAEWARMAVTALTYLLDIGQGLFSIFPMIGKAIAAVAAQTVTVFDGVAEGAKRAFEGDFAGALAAVKNGFKDAGAIGRQNAEDLAAVWNQKLIGQTFRDTMDSLKGIQAEGKDARKQLDLQDVLKRNEEAKKAEAAATKAAAEEQKKLVAMYEAAEKAGDELMRSLALKNDQLELEVELGRKLTPVEQENLKLTRDLTSAKVLLSRADEAAARKAIDHGAALEREIAWQAEARKSNVALVDSIDKRIEQMREETEKQRVANAEMLLSTAQLGDLRAAKLLDLAASAERKAALLDEIDWTGQLGEQQRELARAYRDAAAVAREGAAAKAAKEAQDAWQKTIDGIGQGLTDSLFRAFENGKGFFKNLWDGIVNTFKTTALKLVIQGGDGKGGIMGTLLSAIGLGGPGSAMAGTGGGSSLGGLSNLVSGAKGLFSGSTSILGSSLGNWFSDFGGSVGTATSKLGGWLFDNGFEGLGNMIGGNQGLISDIAGIGGDALGYFGALKSASQGRWGSAAGSAIGTFFGGPIGGTIGNVIGSFVDKAFGGNGTHHAGAGYVSDGTSGRSITDGSMGLSWSYGDSVGKYFSKDIQSALQSVTGGAASMLNTLSKTFGGGGGYQVGGYFASDNDRASQGGRSVLLNGKVLSSWGGSGLDKDATKGLQQLTDALAGQVRDAMVQIDLPSWAKDALNKLGASATMEQLASTVQAITQTQAALKGLSDVFAPLGGVFTRVAGLSADATMQLAQFAGGIDALVAKTQSFVKNYYSSDEQNAIAAAQIQKALSDAGITATLGSKDDFKALVQSSDVQTEAGRKQLAVLLSLNEAFAPVGEYLKDQGKTLADLAAQAPQVAALQALNDSNTAGVTLQQQQADSLVQLDDTFNTVGAGIQAKLESLTESVQAGLAAVAANTAAMNNRLTRWDGNEGLTVVSP